MKAAFLVTVLLAAPILGAAPALAAPAPADQVFVAKVSQGGMFEVAAGKLASTKASAQDVKDFAVAEAHDHTLVGARLKRAASHDGIAFSSALNADFQGKLDKLKGLSGPAFDAAYMGEMADIHAKDGAAFGKEAAESADPGLKAFAAETHVIVQRHIGAIKAAPPPPLS